ncbi:hypothetical protein G3O06_01155 [Burkholderia sp. Ac-20345]|uniref:hypothetical protein n=1 Tax=Burkholderia sp. Ac-20345 TaxID=2703891 RepID=UPI00197C4C68|nr:hypothetical protein [Burkholderia sp. Ac-20345]MBN3776172.1 hypothetical protein [Burkholderia sp. Ac-20345]
MARPLENPERKGDESLFSLALNARCEYALMLLRVVAGEIGSDAFNQHHAEAYRLAARAGYLYASEPIPNLLRDGDELEDAWNDGVKKREEERRAAGEQIRHLDIEKLIEEKDWYALGLPYPEQILWSLKRGDLVRIRWHFLIPDVNSVTYDYQYGEAAFFGALDDLLVEKLDVLLADIARGQPWRHVQYRSEE